MPLSAVIAIVTFCEGRVSNFTIYVPDPPSFIVMESRESVTPGGIPVSCISTSTSATSIPL